MRKKRIEGLLSRPMPAERPKMVHHEGLRSAVDKANQRERAEHPEDRLEGVHGEKAVDGDVDGCDEDAEHRECLCRAEAAESPREQAGKEDGGCSGKCGENADGE